MYSIMVLRKEMAQLNYEMHSQTYHFKMGASCLVGLHALPPLTGHGVKFQEQHMKYKYKVTYYLV